MKTLIPLVGLVACSACAADFYVDSCAGRDTNTGLSEAAPWQSLARVNEAAKAEIKPGDRVLFKRGGLWRGMLKPASGEPGSPVFYGTYGKGPKPILQQSVDRSQPGDWQPTSLPGVWATKPVVPHVGALVWDGRANPGRWSGSFQEGAAGTVKVLEENGEKFVRITCEKAAPKRRSESTIQVWGPEIAHLPPCAVLKLKVRASKPTMFGMVRMSRNNPPWTGALSGSVKTSGKPFDATWRETYAILSRPAASSLDKAFFHLSIGASIDAGASLDIRFLELRAATVDNSSFIERDVGIFIANHGEKWGVKRMYGPQELKNDLDFWYDPAEGTVSVKSETNPGSRFDSIELAKTVHVVSEGSAHDVTYDGLAVRYGAAHGFGGGSTARIVIRNCDIYWIGGGLQFWAANAKGRYPVRYGNGIEFWGTCHDNLVERNRLWQVYDAALTNQTKDNPRHETDVVWRDNVIWQAEYSFEYWNHDPSSYTGNILFEHNTCIDAGYCWSHAQRPNPNGAHLMFYDNAAPTTNFVVRNNVFVRTTDRSTRMWNDWRMKNPAAKDGLDMHDNLYFIPEQAVYEYHPNGRDRRANRNVKPMRFGAGPEAFAAYVAATGLDKGSVYAEPQFKDEARRDYRLAKEILAPDGTVFGARDMPGLDEDQSVPKGFWARLLGL